MAEQINCNAKLLIERIAILPGMPVTKLQVKRNDGRMHFVAGQLQWNLIE